MGLLELKQSALSPPAGSDLLRAGVPCGRFAGPRGPPSPSRRKHLPSPSGRVPVKEKQRASLVWVAEHLKKGRGRRAEDQLQGSSSPLGLVVEG